MEHVGIGFLTGQHNVAGVGFFPCQKLGIKRSIGLLGVIFARNHLGNHILRDGKEIVGGDADIHMVFFHHRAHILHGVGQVVAYALAVAEQVLPFRKDLFLRILRQHDVQNLHRLFAPRGVLLQIAVQCHLEVGRGHQPLFPVLAEDRQKGCVNTLVLEHPYTGGGAEVHGKLPVAEHLDHVIVIQLQIRRRKTCVLDELLHTLEAARPHGAVQPDTGVVGGVAVGGAPFAPCYGRKLASRKPLQRFHAGVVVQIVGGIAADAHFLKGFAGSNKAGVIGGQRDAVLHKKVAVDHKTVGIGAYGQPVYAAVLIFEAVEVGIVDGTRLVGGSKVHQAVL